MNNLTVNMQNILTKRSNLSRSRNKQLRSMQNIKGIEREIIESYRNELDHDVWGNPNKLLEWVKSKFVELRNKNYYSDKISDKSMISERNDSVKIWADMIEDNHICKNNPFLKLKILKSVVSDLKTNNKLFPLVVNKNIFDNAVYEVKKHGLSFKKTYLKLYKQYCAVAGIKVDDVFVNGVRGKWYSLKVPNYAEASANISIFNKIKEFISVLSQGSNWCTRNPKSVSSDFMGMDFHIFVDHAGRPQLCIVGSDKNGGRFKYINGNDQYASIPDKYKEVLIKFLKDNNFDNAVFGEMDTSIRHIRDIFQ